MGTAATTRILRHHVPKLTFISSNTFLKRIFCNQPGAQPEAVWLQAVQYVNKKADLHMQILPRNRRGLRDYAHFPRRNLLLSALKTKYVYRLSKQAA